VNEVLGLMPSFAVQAFIGVVPVLGLHDLPVDLIQIIQTVKEVGIGNLRVSFIKSLNSP
jgi:hypothetical protein